MPLIFLLTVLLIFWIRYASRKSDKQNTQSSAQFWQKEQEANFVRRSDISHLAYLHLPQDVLTAASAAAKSLAPGTPDQEEAVSLYQELTELASAKILNLTGLSNTDLKLTYGAANLDALTACDENFTRLCRVLNRTGRLLKRYEMDAEAICVLSYAISCQSDIQESYLLLASLYQKKGDIDNLYALNQAICHFDNLRRASLEAALASYHVPE